MTRKIYRQLVQPQDPYVDLLLPQGVYLQLMGQAHYNARELKMEIIARLSQVLHYRYEQMAQEALAEKSKPRAKK